MNYTALQSQVASYLHRTDLTTPITDFIEKARTRIGRELRSLEQETTATLSSFTAGVASLPADFQELRRATVSGRTLREVTFEELQYWTASGGPSVFAISNRNFHCPGASSVEILYWKAEAVLSSGSTEHPTMAAHPNLWVSAAVAEGALYCHEWELMQVMEARYQEERDRVNGAARRARFGPAPAPNGADYNFIASGPGL